MKPFQQKILPICFDQVIRTQGLLAYCISLLAHHPRFKEWYYTDHTLTAFINQVNENQYVFMSQYCDICALLDHEAYDYPMGSDPDAILTMLKEKMDNDYYVYLESNEKYIPNTRAQETNRDFTHTQLIYGYSDIDQAVYAAYYDKDRQYVHHTVSYEAIKQAIQTSNPFQPYQFYRYRDVEFPLFWVQIAYDFRSYFDDRDAVIDAERQVIRSPGGKGEQRLQQLLLDHKGTSYFDGRLIGTYYENKAVVMDKLHFLEAQGVPFPNGIVEQYAQIPQLARIVQSLYLKYEITRSSSLIDRMAKHMDTILEMERSLYPCIGECIEDFRIRQNFLY